MIILIIKTFYIFLKMNNRNNNHLSTRINHRKTQILSKILKNKKLTFNIQINNSKTNKKY